MSGKTLYWFTNDLRIRDNRILDELVDASELLCVYVVDPVWFTQRMWQYPGRSALRWQFLLESLNELNRGLMTLGQQLHICYQPTQDALVDLIDRHTIKRLVLSDQFGSYELQHIEDIKQRCPDLIIDTYPQYTLFDEQQLPFSVDQLPGSYSAFRRKVELLEVTAPLAEITLKHAPYLPPMPNNRPLPTLQLPGWLPKPVGSLTSFEGGEAAAWRHLKAYFSSQAPSRYKEVRNELAGWQNSSKFSPWLNHGCISPRQIKQQLERYELSHGANESTQWLYVELLWREYFQWLHRKLGHGFYRFQGLANHPPLTSFYPERFRKWCEGETPYDLVNACMKQLKATGYLSNRGRQIAASCLVNELSVDWRYGAGWFEHHLIDYDPAVNWGNWQYLAGVGVDPRGGRHFNLAKQTDIYDPDGLYRKRWHASSVAALDSVDAADWPIVPEE